MYFIPSFLLDVPVKVIGIFSQRNERNMLWKLVYALYERLSVFRYGRVELVMFISEKEYTVGSQLGIGHLAAVGSIGWGTDNILHSKCLLNMYLSLNLETDC